MGIVPFLSEPATPPPVPAFFLPCSSLSSLLRTEVDQVGGQIDSLLAAVVGDDIALASVQAGDTGRGESQAMAVDGRGEQTEGEGEGGGGGSYLLPASASIDEEGLLDAAAALAGSESTVTACHAMPYHATLWTVPIAGTFTCELGPT